MTTSQVHIHHNLPKPNPVFTVLKEDEPETEFLIEEEIEEHGCFSCFGNTRELSKRASSYREFSEVVVSPKWKNLVMKFSGYFIKKKKKKVDFKYDSFDYALNFDDEDVQERLYRGFSVRFAPPVHLDRNKNINVDS